MTLKGLGLDGTHVLDHIHLLWGDKNNLGSEHSLDGTFYSAEVSDLPSAREYLLGKVHATILAVLCRTFSTCAVGLKRPQVI